MTKPTTALPAGSWDPIMLEARQRAYLQPILSAQGFTDETIHALVRTAEEEMSAAFGQGNSVSATARARAYRELAEPLVSIHKKLEDFGAKEALGIISRFHERVDVAPGSFFRLLSDLPALAEVLQEAAVELESHPGGDNSDQHFVRNLQHRYRLITGTEPTITPVRKRRACTPSPFLALVVAVRWRINGTQPTDVATVKYIHRNR